MSTQLFAFTADERLNRTLSHARLLALLAQPGATVLRVREDENAFGRFLFVTLRVKTVLESAPEPQALTFWGLGYHEARERWLTEPWTWHETTHQPATDEYEALDVAQARALIDARLAYCQSEAAASPAPSARAQLFALVADLTDEDGALCELEDLEALGIDAEGLFDD